MKVWGLFSLQSLLLKQKSTYVQQKTQPRVNFFLREGEKISVLISNKFSMIFFHKNLNLKLFLLKKIGSEINIWFARKRKQKFVCKYRKEIEDDTTEYFRA